MADVAPVAPADALAARIASLRATGAWRADPARFHGLEALARRLAGQRESVRRLLEARLDKQLAEFERTVPHFVPAGRMPAPRGQRPACAPLAELNAHLRRVAAARLGVDEVDAAGGAELASARRFRQAWDRQRTLERLQQAAARIPANAGPLNSHALVLRSLALMAGLSPDYLQRFVVLAETLQWLERAAEPLPNERTPDAKKPGRPKRKK